MDGLIKDYATECLKTDVEQLLDDPYAFSALPTAYDRAVELRAGIIPKLRRIAAALGIDFDELVKAGSPYEREQLRRIEADEDCSHIAIMAALKEQKG
jgi:hypothetical protein